MEQVKVSEESIVDMTSPSTTRWHTLPKALVRPAETAAGISARSNKHLGQTHQLMTQWSKNR